MFLVHGIKILISPGHDINKWLIIKLTVFVYPVHNLFPLAGNSQLRDLLDIFRVTDHGMWRDLGAIKGS